jgi:16S rRNA (guanine527-N7)-methyltransferase
VQGQLLDFLRLLQRWNSVYNLTALDEPRQMLALHLVDCLAVVEPLRRTIGGLAGKRLLDVGSGGGLPGAVLAIVEPRLQVLCVDAVGKKVAFVRQVSAEMSLPNLEAVHTRVERLHKPAFKFDVVASRAFSTLPLLVEVTRGLLNETGIWMAMKGRLPSDEIGNLPPDVQLFHVEPIALPGVDAERCIVWMRPLLRPDAVR